MEFSNLPLHLTLRHLFKSEIHKMLGNNIFWYWSIQDSTNNKTDPSICTPGYRIEAKVYQQAVAQLYLLGGAKCQKNPPDFCLFFPMFPFFSLIFDVNGGHSAKCNIWIKCDSPRKQETSPTGLFWDMGSWSWHTGKKMTYLSILRFLFFFYISMASITSM